MQQSPTMRRRQLGMELRRLRESAELTLDQVARHIGRVPSSVSRIECGHSGARTAHIRALLDLYGMADGPEREALLQLAKDGRQRGWWSEYDDIVGDFDRYLGYEGSAAGLRQYENRVVSGLLQTADYARESIRAVKRYEDPDDLERRVEVRLKRQEALTRTPDPLALWVVLDEAVLRRMVGGPEVMRAQLTHLGKVARLPNVTIQILPFERGAHPATDGPFTIVEFPEEADPDVVYIDDAAGNLYLEKPRDLRRHTSVFNHLLSAAATPQESASMLRRMAKEIT